MKIIIDCMGGDKAPEETVKGAIQAARTFDASISYVWVGNKNDIERIAKEEQFDLSRVEVVHADEVVTMEDEPLTSVRAKPNSSMTVALRLLAEDGGDALVSTCNTGALFTGATLLVRKVKGIQRAGIATVMPFDKPMLLFDSGANVEVTPENLEQFAIVGSAYMKKMFGLENPRVGLLNNGTEACKGTELQQAAYRRLPDSPDVNFVGNIEGRDFLAGIADVIVADGFSGNLILKTCEGVAGMMYGNLKQVFKKNFISKIAAAMVMPGLKVFKKKMDYTEYGGAPLMGIAKPVIKAHGSSNAVAFKNALRQAKEYHDNKVVETIQKSITALKEVE